MTWLSVPAASEYAGRHPQTLYAALRSRELRGGQRGHRHHWRIHTDDLDRWMLGLKPRR